MSAAVAAKRKESILEYLRGQQIGWGEHHDGTLAITDDCTLTREQVADLFALGVIALQLDVGFVCDSGSWLGTLALVTADD